MEAVNSANGQVLAATVAADGSPGYWSVLIVDEDSPINNLNDLLAKRKDLTFGNGDPNSTSGFLITTTSSPKTISPPRLSSAPSTPGMKPTRWPSPTSRWMLPLTTPKPRQAENLRAGEVERTESDLEVAANARRSDRLA